MFYWIAKIPQIICAFQLKFIIQNPKMVPYLTFWIVHNLCLFLINQLSAKLSTTVPKMCLFELLSPHNSGIIKITIKGYINTVIQFSHNHIFISIKSVTINVLTEKKKSIEAILLETVILAVSHLDYCKGGHAFE